ncbi:MAG: winged helix-turn-helix domain-containing protein [Acidimicrobiia bacterium]
MSEAGEVLVSAARARRIALAAQGFASPRPSGRVDRRHVRRMLARVGLVQIDSVNVIVRSQELPLFARLGPHRRDLLSGMVADGELFEYWGHEASLLPIELFPLLRWRMAAAGAKEAGWNGLIRLAHERPDYVEAVYDEVRERGLMSASELDDPGAKSGPWWGWRHGKQALEYLFWCGRLSARRRTNFERVYDLTERLIPAEWLAAPIQSQSESHKELLVRAADALGIGTARDLADYYRLNIPYSRPLLAELVEEQRLVPARVEGWAQPAYLHPEARVPRRVDARSLLSPFDSLIWERSRTERLFDFRYRLEIYTPKPKRIFGYYVLPFLLGDELVARVDLKAERTEGVLRVRGAFAEPGHDPIAIAEPLGEELALLGDWLGLERVIVDDHGDLAPSLEGAIPRSGR